VKPAGKAFTGDGMKGMVTPRAFETAEIPAILED
jgi:N-ethylmaleimide reductase